MTNSIDLSRSRCAAALWASLALFAGCSEVIAPADPQPPADLRGELISGTTVRLTWSPRPRNEWISSYVIFRNGDSVASVSNPEYVEANLLERVNLEYAVAAVATNGVRSLASAPVALMTRDETSPRVTQTLPAHGAGPLQVVGISIRILFSEPVDPSSVTAETIRVETNGMPVTGTVTYYSNDQSAGFIVHGRLPGSSTIRVLATSGIRDPAGNRLSDFSYTFTTIEDEKPRVVSTSPLQGARDVSLNAEARITFSEPMKPGIFTWLNVSRGWGNWPPQSSSYDAATNTLTVSFGAGGLLSDRTYSLLIGYPWPAEDIAGNTMQPYTLTFTTLDIGAPRVVSVFPADRSTGADPTAAIRVTFSEPMNASSISTRLSVYRSDQYPGDPGGPVTGSMSYDAATQTAVFTPDAPLASGKRYLVTLVRGALDETGVATEDVFSSEFWTR